MAAMRDRHAMTGSQPAEIMPFYCAGKPFADADPDDVDILAREKMRSSDFRADREHGILGDAKLSEAGLRLTFPFAKWPRWGFVTRLTLAVPTPSCRAVYPSLSRVRTATTWQLSILSTVTGT